jgi:hypothetical protein
MSGGKYAINDKNNMTTDANAYPNTGGLIVNQYLGVLGNIFVGQNLTVGGIATYDNLQAGNISALSNLFVIGNTYQTGNIIFTNPGTLSFGPNSVVPKSYIDTVSVIWGV